MSRRKVFFSLLSGLVVLMFFDFLACAGGLKSTVPEGTEIKDPNLEQLFAPEFPYEWVKVIDTKEGKRYVIVKAKGTISRQMWINYEDKTLFNRKITIYRTGSVHTQTLLVAEMRIHRIVSENPYVVEYSKVENVKLKPVPASEAEDVVRKEGNYLIIRIDKDFGRVFKRVEIYPEKDAPCPEPPIIGKYPNSRSIMCTERNNWISFIYISKDKAEDIYNYYQVRLKAHYKHRGFNYAEWAWKVNREFGIQIADFIEVDRWGKYLDEIRTKGKPVKSPLSSDGMVFNIVIRKGSSKSFIQDYSFINISYTTDPEIIRKNFERIKGSSYEEKEK